MKRTKKLEQVLDMMFSREEVSIKGSKRKGRIIQQMNMDGECDIYDKLKNDIVEYGVNHKDIQPLLTP